MPLYGPHCHHDECGWFECDETGLVDFPCQEQGGCPHCGPDSEQWSRVADGMRDWLTRCFGTVEVERLRELDGITEPQRRSALRYAELLRTHE